MSDRNPDPIPCQLLLVDGSKEQHAGCQQVTTGTEARLMRSMQQYCKPSILAVLSFVLISDGARQKKSEQLHRHGTIYLNSRLSTSKASIQPPRRDLIDQRNTPLLAYDRQQLYVVHTLVWRFAGCGRPRYTRDHHLSAA